MVADSSLHLEIGDAMVKKKSVGRKKNGAKVSKKISKSEREKLKRDHMNVLFLQLGKILEPSNHNNGKSCMITDTIRILRHLLAQVDCLKKENATLLSEFQYLTVEKDELQEEKSALEFQIVKLQAEIEKYHSRSLWTMNPSQSQNLTGTVQPVKDQVLLPAVDLGTQAVGPVLVMPVQRFYPSLDISETISKLPPYVSRPHARYPSPSHNWPSNILSEQPLADKKVL